MKIIRDMVGKKVRWPHWHWQDYMEILYVGNLSVFSRRKDGAERMDNLKDEDWELYEEPKKPSQRIRELYSPQTDEAVHTAWITAIIQYLDEQAEKK